MEGGKSELLNYASVNTDYSRKLSHSGIKECILEQQEWVKHRPMQ